MFNQTGDGATILSRYGTWPGYLSLINKDFDRASETAWGVKITYDFKGLGLPGLTGFVWFAQGTGAIDPATGGRRTSGSSTSTSPTPSRPGA
jgi:outer membrane OprD family porin